MFPSHAYPRLLFRSTVLVQTYPAGDFPPVMHLGSSSIFLPFGLSGRCTLHPPLARPRCRSRATASDLGSPGWYSREPGDVDDLSNKDVEFQWISEYFRHSNSSILGHPEAVCFHGLMDHQTQNSRQSAIPITWEIADNLITDGHWNFQEQKCRILKYNTFFSQKSCMLKWLRNK